MEMTNQIATALEVPANLVTDVTVEGKMVDFRLNGVWYYAKLSRGQFKADNMRRASY